MSTLESDQDALLSLRPSLVLLVSRPLVTAKALKSTLLLTIRTSFVMVLRHLLSTPTIQSIVRSSVTFVADKISLVRMIAIFMVSVWKIRLVFAVQGMEAALVSFRTLVMTVIKMCVPIMVME